MKDDSTNQLVDALELHHNGGDVVGGLRGKKKDMSLEYYNENCLVSNSSFPTYSPTADLSTINCCSTFPFADSILEIQKSRLLLISDACSSQATANEKKQQKKEGREVLTTKHFHRLNQRSEPIYLN